MRHGSLVVTAKKRLKSVHICISRGKIKTGVPLFMEHRVDLLKCIVYLLFLYAVFSGQSSVGRHRFVLGRMKRTHAEFWFDDNATEDNDPDNNDNSDNDSTDNSDGGDGVVPEHPMMQLLKTRLDFLDDDDEDTVASGDNFPTGTV